MGLIPDCYKRIEAMSVMYSAIRQLPYRVEDLLMEHPNRRFIRDGQSICGIGEILCMKSYEHNVLPNSSLLHEGTTTDDSISGVIGRGWKVSK